MKKYQELLKLTDHIGMANDHFMEILRILDESEMDFNDYFAEKYPFHKSFDELTADIMVWEEAIREKIEKEEKEKMDLILSSIENMAFALDYDLSEDPDIAYDMIFIQYLDGNYNWSKKEIKQAVQ